MKMVAVARSRSTLLGAASRSMSVTPELQAPRTVVASTRSRLSRKRPPRTTDPVVQPERSITMEKLFERCAGLDIRKDVIVAYVRVPDAGGGRRQETRSFQTTIAALLRCWTGCAATA
jgi:hypothetical protein